MLSRPTLIGRRKHSWDPSARNNSKRVQNFSLFWTHTQPCLEHHGPISASEALQLEQIACSRWNKVWKESSVMRRHQLTTPENDSVSILVPAGVQHSRLMCLAICPATFPESSAIQQACHVCRILVHNSVQEFQKEDAFLVFEPCFKKSGQACMSDSCIPETTMMLMPLHQSIRLL